MELLFFLSQDGDKRKLAEHLEEKYMKWLAKLISTSSNLVLAVLPWLCLAAEVVVFAPKQQM